MKPNRLSGTSNPQPITTSNGGGKSDVPEINVVDIFNRPLDSLTDPELESVAPIISAMRDYLPSLLKPCHLDNIIFENPQYRIIRNGNQIIYQKADNPEKYALFRDFKTIYQIIEYLEGASKRLGNKSHLARRASYGNSDHHHESTRLRSQSAPGIEGSVTPSPTLLKKQQQMRSPRGYPALFTNFNQTITSYSTNHLAVEDIIKAINEANTHMKELQSPDAVIQPHLLDILKETLNHLNGLTPQYIFEKEQAQLMFNIAKFLSELTPEIVG